MGMQLTGLEVLPPFAIMAIVRSFLFSQSTVHFNKRIFKKVAIAMATVTEVVQNGATANIFLPILAQMVH